MLLKYKKMEFTGRELKYHKIVLCFIRFLRIYSQKIEISLFNRQQMFTTPVVRIVSGLTEKWDPASWDPKAETLKTGKLGP